MRPEMRDILKKLPKRRGHGQNRARTVRVKTAYTPINLSTLESVFSAGDTITLAVLHNKGLTKGRGGRITPVKVLGSGELTKKLALSGLLVSDTAKSAVEAAGGSVL